MIRPGAECKKILHGDVKEGGPSNDHLSECCVNRGLNLINAMFTWSPQAIDETASKPNWKGGMLYKVTGIHRAFHLQNIQGEHWTWSTRNPEAPLDTNRPAPDNEDQSPATNPWGWPVQKVHFHSLSYMGGRVVRVAGCSSFMHCVHDSHHLEQRRIFLPTA